MNAYSKYPTTSRKRRCPTRAPSPEVGADYRAVREHRHLWHSFSLRSGGGTSTVNIAEGEPVTVVGIDFSNNSVHVHPCSYWDSDRGNFTIPISIFRGSFQKLPSVQLPDVSGIYYAKHDFLLNHMTRLAIIEIKQGQRVVIDEIDDEGLIHVGNEKRNGTVYLNKRMFWELVSIEKRSGKPMSVERGLELLHPEQEAELRSTDNTDKARMAVKMAAHQAVVEALSE